ncbi:MAG: L-threonylcarbamoyladenylate synthase [Dissulfuribacterales bacterium]
MRRLKETESDAVAEAVRVLRAGGIVAYSTETSYGLGASIEHADAMSRIYLIKKRSIALPLLVLIAEISWLDVLVQEMPDEARRLMALWPGPLTLLFRARPELPFHLVGPDGLIGVRISSHAFARALVQELGCPVTATSANLHGMPACHDAREVMAQLRNPAPDLVIDSGRSSGGPPSTIVDVSVRPFRVVRKGAMSEIDLFL